MCATLINRKQTLLRKIKVDLTKKGDIPSSWTHYC